MGIAYRYAFFGILCPNAVSNTATCGTPGIAASHASIPIRFAGYEEVRDRSTL